MWALNGRLWVGDVRDGLRAMLDSGMRAQVCCCSPPYWGLRDYGTSQWDGGTEDCDHLQSKGQRQDTVTMYGAESQHLARLPYRDICGKCGARRIDRQLGLESTIAEYVAAMVDVFRLVRDVLADDGTLWLNLGDSYANTGKSGGGTQGDRWQDAGGRTDDCAGTFKYATDGLKPKDLCGIPWRVAFALQADGWYLRSDIIWHKPNPMPESVTDRPTKAHEYLFLLAKSERYYYDAAAIAEPLISSGGGGFYCNDSAYRKEIQTGGASSGQRERDWGRNRRTVWSITTEPYAGAHFAVMPTSLVEPCIMAGSRVGDIVLDPFMGSGTVAQVAQSLGRRWIGCELNPYYAKMISQRTAQQALVLEAAD